MSEQKERTKTYFELKDSNMGEALREYFKTHPDGEKLETFIANYHIAASKVGLGDATIQFGAHMFFAGIRFAYKHRDQVVEQVAEQTAQPK